MTPTTRTTYLRQFGVVIAIQLAALLVAAGPVAPITYILPSDESMVDRTATIVFGRVLSAVPAPDGLRLPATDFTFQVEEVLKGNVASSTIVVRQPGGAGPGGLMMRIPGLPMLQEGERVLLFVADQSSGEESGGIYRTVELALGIFFEVQVEGGALLEREPSLREDVLETAAGASAETIVGLRDSSRFRRWIRERAAGEQRAADYFVPERDVVRGPVTVRRPYRFSRTGKDCKYPNRTKRWTEFERGEFVAFGIQRGGQPGLTEESTRRAVNNSMRAWNSDPLSRVDLRYLRNPVKPEVSEYRDGRNLIMFDDPFNERGELEPDGGAIGWARTWSRCHQPPVRRPPPYEEYGDVRITQSDIITRRGLDEHLERRSDRESDRLAFMEELLGHELGHSLGFAHPCGDDESGACGSNAEREAIMHATRPLDGRGARLSLDDRAILRRLYPVPPSERRPPPPPTGLTATPITGTTARLTWKDRSSTEDGFIVRKQLSGAAWTRAARTSADMEEVFIYGLRPGERYRFLVRAWLDDLYSDSKPVTITMPSAATGAGSLQSSQFGINFSATANGSTTIGTAANWSSDQGILYWLFDPPNPEALVKVLDGRTINGHWWFDLAVASDLRTISVATHRGTGDEWVAITGLGKDVFTTPGEAANRLVHCAFPATRADSTCAVSGYGTTISLRDAWDSSGRVPAGYFGESLASVAVRQLELEAGPADRLFVPVQSSHSAANPSDDRLIRLTAPSVAAAASPIQGARFGIRFSAKANDTWTTGKSANWSSDQGVLYWLFDPQNPEALVKVLDGRNLNGHWWFDLAVASDLHSVTRVTYGGTGDQWVVHTGLGKNVFSEPGGTEDRLVHCAYPANREDPKCVFWGYGTTISLRDAWDSSGRIPSIHYD